jgi:HD-like signal output (HDOD) protein
MIASNELPALGEEAAEKLLKGIHIPPQPQILADLHMEMAMPDFSLAGVAALISRDVALSGYVLKAVNSAHFGLKVKVGSVAQAIGLLGLDSLINIVNALSLRSSLSDGEVTALADFWDNAKDVAEGSALISRTLGVSNADELYALGLFHNCGIPLLLNKHPNYLQVALQAYSSKDMAVTEVENQLIHSNHAVLGYYVAKSWKLPGDFCNAIALHHRVEQVLADERESEALKNLLAILKLASHLCGTAGTMGAAEDHEFIRMGSVVLHYLGLTDLDLADLRDDLASAGIG